MLLSLKKIALISFINSVAITAFAVTGTYQDIKSYPYKQSCFLKISALPNSESIGFCGGTVVGNKTLITANHCNLEGESLNKIADQRKIVMTGTTIKVLCPEAEPRQVVRRWSVVEGSTSEPLDIIYFETDKAIGVKPIPVPKDKEQFFALLKHNDCAILGYGQDNYSHTGHLNAIKAPLFADGMPLNSSLFKYDMIYTIIKIDDSLEPIIEGVQPGDSGSGLFCKDTDEQWYLMGVHRTLTMGFLGDSTSLGDILVDLHNGNVE